MNKWAYVCPPKIDKKAGVEDNVVAQFHSAEWWTEVRNHFCSARHSRSLEAFTALAVP